MKKQKARFAACTVKPHEVISIGGTRCVVIDSETSRYGTGTWHITAHIEGDPEGRFVYLSTQPDFPIRVLKPRKKK